MGTESSAEQIRTTLSDALRELRAGVINPAVARAHASLANSINSYYRTQLEYARMSGSIPAIKALNPRIKVGR